MTTEYVDIFAFDAEEDDYQRRRQAESAGNAGVARQENGPSQDGKRSAASVCVDICLRKYELHISDKDEPFAVPRTGPRVVRMLRGGKGSLRAELAKDYRRETGKVAPQQALADAFAVIEGEAQELEPTTLHLRVAEAEGCVWFDLGDSTGRVVRIDSTGWEVVDEAPVLFQRTALTAASPVPEHGGSRADLLNLTNAAEADKPLLVAAMVATFFEKIAHPIVAFSGEQGTGKSTNAMKVTGILDPTPVPLRKAPRDAEAWVTAASGSWVVTVDNLSVVQDWFSDALCRASTGDGDVKRRLYTDSGLTVFSFRRCVILTGIDLGGLRGDLTERLLRIELDRISTTQRRSEQAMLSEYEAAKPRILGALFDVVAGVRGILPSVELEKSLRLADFHRIVAAVDQVLGTTAEARYLAQYESMAADSLTSSPLIAALIERGLSFTGTATELKAELESSSETWRPPAGWPRRSHDVTTALKRNAPALRSQGWTVENRENREHVTEWTVIPPEKARNSYPHYPHHPQRIGCTRHPVTPLPADKCTGCAEVVAA